MPFLGIDHIDLRVPALGAVETFYDTLFVRLGLTRAYAALTGAATPASRAASATAPLSTATSVRCFPLRRSSFSKLISYPQRRGIYKFSYDAQVKTNSRRAD